MRMRNLLKNEFQKGEADRALVINFLWGLKSVDRDGTSKWDPEDIGEI
jgi:hypothetical protein